MNNRWFAILIVACLVLVGAGCASEEQRQMYKDEVMLPRQTGSNLSRRFIPEDESSFKKTKKKKRDSKRPAKKPVKTERTEAEHVKPTVKPAVPEETPTPAPPDRFR